MGKPYRTQSDYKRALETVVLRKDQEKIADSKARFKVVACGRRWGKTLLGLVMAAQYARYGKRVWWVAPTYGLAFHPWRDLKSAFYDKWAYKLESERFIELEGGGTLTVKSADDPDALRGVGLDLVIVDEAAYIPEAAWVSALRPALADRRGKALLISTPHGRNWFYHAFLRGQDKAIRDWEAWQAPTSANPLIADQEIVDAKSILPLRVFEQEYEATFIEDGGVVFRELTAATTAPADAQPIPGHRYLMGVDFGRYQDFTACALLDASTRPVTMTALTRFNEIHWGRQRERIAALARRWNVVSILAEANAMGEPNIEALRAEGLPVLPFVTTAASKGPLIDNLSAAIENGELRLIPADVLIGELSAYTYRVERRTGRYLYGAPPGLHDDTVIALALAWNLASIPRLSLGIAEN